MTDAWQQIRLIDGPVDIRGALEIVPTPAGVQPRRLPQWTAAQSDLSMERQATAGSGVRLVFRTAARVVELDVLTTVPKMVVDEPDPDGAGRFEMTVDGEPFGVRKAPVGNVIQLD